MSYGLPEEPITQDDIVQNGASEQSQQQQATVDTTDDDDSQSGEDDQQSQQQQSSDQNGAQASDESQSQQASADGGGSEGGGEEGQQQSQAQQGDIIQELSQITGLEIKDTNDLVSNLSDYAKYKADPYKHLGISSAMKAAIEAEKAGIPASKFFRISELKPETMGNKELLRQQSMIKDPAGWDKHHNYLNQEFERNYDKEYSILNDKRTSEDFETDAEWQQFQSDKQYAQDRLNYQAELAKGEIQKWKDKALEPEAPKGPTEEDIAREARTHQLEVNRVMEGFKEITFKIDGQNVNVAAKPEEISKIKGFLDNPSTFLQEIGFDIENNKLDLQKIRGLVSLHVLRDTIGNRLAVHKVESKNRDIITNKLENGQVQQTVNARGDEFIDDLAEAAHGLAGLKK